MNPSEILMLLQGGDHFQEEDNSDFMPEMPFMTSSYPQNIARPQGVARLQGVSALGKMPSQPARDSQGFVGVGSLYDGARAGMRSVRDLTNTSEEDQRRGIGMGLMRLFSGMSKTGYGSGIRGTLGALTENIPEAMSSHQGHLDKRRTQNMEELNAFMKEQNELREYNRKLLDMETQQNKWWREQHEKRRHNLAQEANWRRMAKGMSYGSGSISPELLAQIPGLETMPAIATKQEHSQYVRDRKNFGHVLSELKSIRSSWNDFRELSKDDFIDPQAPYWIGEVANKAGDLMGTITGNPQLKKQTAKREALQGKIGRFKVELERKLKGGVLSDGLRKHFDDKEILPDLNQRADSFDLKLRDIEREVLKYERAATLALQTGRALSPWDLEDLMAEDEMPDDSEPSENSMEMDINPDQIELDEVNAQLARMGYKE
jgi:hypothetical protein